MAHTRIRKFNTKDTYPEQKLDNDLCQAVVADNMVFIRGQIAQDLDTRKSLHVGDAVASFACVLDREVEAATHQVLFSRVLETHRDPVCALPSLVYTRRAYSVAQPIA